MGLGYLYEDDLHSGALVYDFGYDEVVASDARRVNAIFTKHGVQEVITIDPHTTVMLHSVYPKFVDGYDVRVRGYLEVPAERGLPGGGRARDDVVVHNSCTFARYEDVMEGPRRYMVLRRPGRVLAPGQGGRGRCGAGRAAACRCPQLRDDMPDLPCEPAQIGQWGGQLPGYLRVPGFRGASRAGTADTADNGPIGVALTDGTAKTSRK